MLDCICKVIRCNTTLHLLFYTLSITAIIHRPNHCGTQTLVLLLYVIIALATEKGCF